MRRSGFSLLEVILAVTIAAAGACLVYQGLAIAVSMQARQRFAEGCTAFLEMELERIVAEIDSPAGAAEGAHGGAVKYRVHWDAPDELKSLTRVTVRLSPASGPAPFPDVVLVTYLSRHLRRSAPEPLR